jgi:hypothetical protein
MFQGIVQQLTPTNWVAAIIQTAVLTLLVRLLVWLFGKAPKHERWYWVVCPLGIFVVLTIIESIAGLDKRPALTDSIQYEMSGMAGATPYVAIVVRIVNTGAASTIAPYALCARFAGRTDEICGQGQTIPDVFPLTMANGSSIYMFGRDALNRKTAEVPVPKGGSVFGWLMFMFPGSQLADLNSAATVFNLKYVDAWGKLHTGEMKTTGQRDSNIFDFPEGVN